MKLKKATAFIVVLMIALTALPVTAFAQARSAGSKPAELRRPVSPEQPMWIVHIDTWNNADPAKIIDLIPEDILPYVVFNISMSINWDSKTDTWGITYDGYEVAKSWLRTCAEKQVWAFIQPASGGQCHFPDYPDKKLDGTVFEEFFRDYPNFLGFNYCEQFWGFEQEDFPVTLVERYKHFANLLELTNRYGGYLVVSWCGNQWSPNINPLAMIKRVPEFEKACRKYTENFILCEKYTQWSYIHDMESLVLGAYLSGYCGQYGLRYDETGWTDKNGEQDGKNRTQDKFNQATGLATQIEKLMQAGLTVIDGPELIWQDDFKEVGEKNVSGYRSRQWEMFDQFQNVSIDLFRKVIDGTIRIPTREEVIKNTKVVVIQDVNRGDNDAKYSTPKNLFKGLYQMKDDGELRNNHNFYKRTGRYPSIPVVYGLADDLAKSFEVQVKASDYFSRWGNQDKKVAEFNKLFPKEYAGTVYLRPNQNSWTVYNPLKTGKAATGRATFKYNTADYFEISLSQYSSGVINEYSDSLNIYLNNYDNATVKPTDLRTDLIKIYGCSEKPELSYKDRGYKQSKSVVTTHFKDGVFTVKIKHNGPIDIKINCSGKNKDRETEYTKAELSAPERPPVYTGDRQYEAEHFDYKNISKLVKNGCRTRWRISKVRAI